MYQRIGQSALLFAIMAAVACAAGAEEGKTFAERLGWGPEDRVLIIHSDDIGMSYATNQATIETLEFGTVTSVSVMMPTPWVVHWRDTYLKDNPDVCMGLHLTHTNEWRPYRWGPVADRDSVPGLLDPQGYMWPSVSDVVENASPEEVETEIRAQIALAEQMGLPITHMDTHMGTLRAPEFVNVFIDIAIEKQIPIRFPGPAEIIRRDWGYDDEAEAMTERLWDAGLPVLDYLHTASYGWDTTDKVEHYVDAIRNLEPGITEMIVHPTKPDPVIDVITNRRAHLYGDYYALISDEVKQAIEEEGVIQTTWRELMERRQAAEE